MLVVVFSVMLSLVIFSLMEFVNDIWYYKSLLNNFVGMFYYINIGDVCKLYIWLVM